MARPCSRGAVAMVLFVLPALVSADQPAQLPGVDARVAALEAAVASLQSTVSMQGERIGDLTQRVGSMEATTRPQYETVYCDQGQTVMSVLDRHQAHLGPLTISIVGVCTEAVEIARDDVTLRGESGGSGLQAPSDTVVSLQAARGIILDQLTIRAGGAGISASNGSSFRGYNLRVEGNTTWGVTVGYGSSGFLWSSIIRNNLNFGVEVRGVVELHGCEIVGNQWGVYAHSGGTAYLSESTTVSQNGQGITAFAGGTGIVNDTTIEGNGEGITVAHESHAVVVDSAIANNSRNGIAVGGASTLTMGRCRVTDNAGAGIEVAAASRVSADDSFILRNGRDGIVVLDMSHGQATATAIDNNAGYGIYCGAPEPILPVQSLFDFPHITFSGNLSGDTNCPRP